MKKLFITFVCLVTAIAAFAENGNESPDSTLLLANKFSKNWEIHLYVGAQNFLAEYTRSNTFNDMWCPGIDFNINKWASPGWGFGLGVNAAGYKGLYYTGDKKAIYAEPDDPVYEKEKGFHMADGLYGNVFAKAMFNATNIIGGYKPGRVFELTGYLGGGVIFPMCKVSYSSVGASFNAGLNFQFHVSKSVLLGFSVRGALYSDGFNGISYLTSEDHHNITLDGMIGATAGVAYKFGYVDRKNKVTGEIEEYEWVYAERMVNDAVHQVETAKDAEIAVEREKAETAEASLVALRDENGKLQARNVVQDVDYWIHIAFAIDRWKITNNEKVNLMSASQYIKSHPGTVFYVRGYADKQTATPSHNSMLAGNRANAVRDVLVNEFGVDPAQLEVEQYGGVDYMYFNDEVCSRCVIISSK